MLAIRLGVRFMLIIAMICCDWEVNDLYFNELNRSWCAYNPSSKRDGSSILSRTLQNTTQKSNENRGRIMLSLYLHKNVTASRPSISLWSYVSAKYITGRALISPCLHIITKTTTKVQWKWWDFEMLQQQHARKSQKTKRYQICTYINHNWSHLCCVHSQNCALWRINNWSSWGHTNSLETEQTNHLQSQTHHWSKHSAIWDCERSSCHIF